MNDDTVLHTDVHALPNVSKDDDLAGLLDSLGLDPYLSRLVLDESKAPTVVKDVKEFVEAICTKPHVDELYVRKHDNTQR